MIKVDKLSYSFPQKELYNNISFTLEAGQHCAFIGTSGSGKSTLANILMDPDHYMFDGKLDMSPNCRIGYVSQFLQPQNTKEMTVFEYIAEEFMKLQNELTAICKEMETSPSVDSLLEKYQKVSEAFAAMDGDDFESSIHKKLRQANLIKHKELKVSELSGGEFKLVQVIKELLQHPDFIIMDEPDAFLDFENLNALKDLINSHKGTMLVITHNRYLLNYCFNKILHLENMDIQEFDGRYIEYNFALLQRKIDSQELAAADTEEIERNIIVRDQLRAIADVVTDAARGKALNARVKYLERLESRRIKAPFVELKQPDIRFAVDHEIEETIALKVHGYSAAFDEVLLENVSFELKSTDKVALIGSNGTGKTTLLRDIYKNEQACIEIRNDVKVAYLSQLQDEMLNGAHTILEEFFDTGFNTSDEIKAYLSKVGVDPEALGQKIGTLSGGEKNILQLAKVAAKPADMLLLDEPTSHLDTYSQIALEKAIVDYKGAILMISHDFYMIVNCMDYVFILEDQTIRKMSMRKFRQMVYKSHIDKNYLELEQKKKSVEMKIESALQNTDFELAKVYSQELEALIKLL